MLRYGTDKPDLRNPLRIADVTEVFRGGRLRAVRQAGGDRRRGARHPRAGRRRQAARFFDKLNDWAREEGMGGLGYIIFDGGGAEGADRQEPGAGAHRSSCARQRGAAAGDAVFFVCRAKARGREVRRACAASGSATELGLREKNAFRFCWIVDFPMYERNEDTGLIDFTHNPFSMPQGGMEALRDAGPADDQGLPVRHRLQRHRAVLGRHPQPPARHHVQGVRDRRLRRGRGRAALRRHVQRLPATARRRTAARRPASTASSCCWPTSPTSARSSPSR